jgi:hypothetical protein
LSKQNVTTVILALTSAIAIAGEVLKPGTRDKPTLIEVTTEEAKDLLRRGKAVLHDHDPESGNSVLATGGKTADKNYTDDPEANGRGPAETPEREAAALAEKEAADKVAAEEAAAATKTGKHK